jgi:hypothetical protein
MEPRARWKYFRQHPALEFAQGTLYSNLSYTVFGTLIHMATGNFWKDINSLILSHCIDEALIFLPTGPEAINTDAEFTAYIESSLPPYAIAAGIASQIISEYPPVNSTNSPYATEEQRMLDYTAQTTFLSNVRTLTTAYTGRTYNVQFSAFGGTHGSDILATWYNPFILYNVSGIDVPF